MDQTMTETLPATTIPEPMLTHDDCLTSIVTHFLLGRVSMDEVCQFCVLHALAPLHPWQMSIYVVGSDSLFRIVGSFGKGPGQDVLDQHSCLDEPNVGEELRSGQPLATFPMIDMRTEQFLSIADLHDGPQVLWPLTTAHRLVGVMHVSFPEPPDAHTTATALDAIAGPIALALDMTSGREQALMSHAPDAQERSRIVHPSQLGPIPASVGMPRTLSAVPHPDADITATAPGATSPAKATEQLTARQMRVLSLMAKGMTNGQIARILAFSESTVRQETMAIYRNLQVKGRAEAVEVGLRRGLIATTPVS